MDAQTAARLTSGGRVYFPLLDSLRGLAALALGLGLASGVFFSPSTSDGTDRSRSWRVALLCSLALEQSRALGC